MDCREFAEKYAWDGLPKNEMLPNGTDAQTCLKILVEHFLGNYIIMYPGSTKQWNTEATFKILELYPQGSIRKIKPRY